MATTLRIHGFAPLAGPGVRVLILGSVPSVASLEKHQYYGKPQNAFWKLMDALFAVDAQWPYEERAAKLVAAGVAVWDVIGSCVRPGSLDSAIDMSSVEVNDFAGFMQQYPAIQDVFFNGRKAEEIFTRRVSAGLAELRPHMRYHSLPSTSPAMASLGFAAKLERWQAVAHAARGQE